MWHTPCAAARCSQLTWASAWWLALQGEKGATQQDTELEDRCVDSGLSRVSHDIVSGSHIKTGTGLDTSLSHVCRSPHGGMLVHTATQ